MLSGYAAGVRIPHPRDLPEHAMRCFEAATGLAVCCHDPTRVIWRFLEPRRMQHNFHLCLLAKRSRQAACDRSCTARWRPALAERTGGVVKRCHAGLVEWAVPIHDEGGRLWTVVFAGARSAGPGLVLDLDEPLQPAPWTRPAARLPPVGEEEAARILELLRQLAARLDRWRREDLPRLAAPVAAGRGRREEIHVWIQQHHHRDVGLADLARHLGLSGDRAGHAVSECCGAGFTALLIRERLRTAADLLRRTDLPVREIAAHSGFRNRANFHQQFRAATGATPGRYRRSGAG